ncbi:MAG: hypothetical protein MI975_22220 [Cytophagales bacterium]|nr:hypothetical protein [Cytophagales bacterium]
MIGLLFFSKTCVANKSGKRGIIINFFKPLFIVFLLSSATVLVSCSSNLDTKITEKAVGTGYIDIKEINGRWCFVDLDGYPFFSIGINHVTYKGDIDAKTKRDEYQQNLIEQYPADNGISFSSPKWAAHSNKIMDDLRVNTIGGWSEIPNFRDEKYYITILYVSSSSWALNQTQDFFSDLFIKNAENTAKREIMDGDFLEDENLIGHCIDNEVDWSGFGTKRRSIAVRYLNFHKNASGKKVIIEYLKEKLEIIDKFNEVFGTDFENWDEAYEYQKYLKFKLGYKKLEDEIIEIIANQYYMVCSEAIRKYDPNHLVMGDRLVSFLTPKGVVKAAGKYLDVLTVNNYYLKFGLQKILPVLQGNMRTGNCLESFYETSGKPILITEFGFRARTKNNPSDKPWIYLTYNSQDKRGKKTYDYIIKHMDTDYIVGYHVFQWFDQPSNGRSSPADGENNNFGIVNLKNDLYSDYTMWYKKANEEVNNIIQVIE